MNPVGIIGFGGYIPKFRIKAEDIALVYNQDSERIKKGLKIKEKSVPNKDEDTVTISVQAARNALSRAHIPKQTIGAVYVGSESHPYAVKPSAGIVGEALGIGRTFTAADTEFACKAGTAALQMAAGLVKSDMVQHAIAIGADTSQSKQGDILEYTAGAGGAAFILGRENIVAQLMETVSLTSDTPDFWRRQTQSEPTHLGRFTAKPAYFKHVIDTTQLILDKTGFSVQDFDHVVFHQPNGKFPRIVAKHFGFTDEQLQHGLLVQDIGNTYSGASMLGLCNVLENAKPYQKILVVSYGSGAGSDAFVFQTTELLSQVQTRAPRLQDYIKQKQYISYPHYLKHMELIH